MGTIKRQTWAAYGCLLEVNVRGRGLGLWPVPRLYACSVTQKRRCSCSMQLVALYKRYIPFHLPIIIIPQENLIYGHLS